MECDRPLRAVCLDCDFLDFWRCDTYGCGPCGETKRRRLQRVIEDGSTQHLIAGLRAYFITLTAPGVRDHNQYSTLWVQGRRIGPVRDCNCHQHGLSDGRWNAQESACWNRLRTTLARDRAVVFAGAVETQRRGLLHRHVVLFTDQPLSPPEVQEYALRAGYGCVVDVEPLENPAKAGRYVAKYVTKSTAQRPEVPWAHEHVNTETGEITDRATTATFRLWSAAHAWGITIKQLRDVARDQARARARYLRELDDANDQAEDDALRSAAGPAPGSLLDPGPP